MSAAGNYRWGRYFSSAEQTNWLTRDGLTTSIHPYTHTHVCIITFSNVPLEPHFHVVNWIFMHVCGCGAGGYAKPLHACIIEMQSWTCVAVCVNLVRSMRIAGDTDTRWQLLMQTSSMYVCVIVCDLLGKPC